MLLLAQRVLQLERADGSLEVEGGAFGELAHTRYPQVVGGDAEILLGHREVNVPLFHDTLLGSQRKVEHLERRLDLGLDVPEGLEEVLIAHVHEIFYVVGVEAESERGLDGFFSADCIESSQSGKTTEEGQECAE